MTIWTVGHSNRTIEDFVDMLKSVNITAIADVRSIPYSRYSPQFNGTSLRAFLSKAHIRYAFLGESLGARPNDPSVYRDGRVSFPAITTKSYFQEGLARVIKGASQYRLALMCSEKDPIHCHRMALIGHELKKLSVDLEHILEDGRVESNAVTEYRLRRALGINDIDLFQSQDELVEEAYTRLARQIAYQAELDDSP